MDGSVEELFALWTPQLEDAPDGSPGWSNWAKPALFASMGVVALDVQPRPAADGFSAQVAVPGVQGNCAIVVDLPGVQAVEAGLALAAKGYVPVPLYNAWSGQWEVIDMHPVKEALVAAAPILRTTQFGPDLPPAFLLDSRRTGRIPPGPGQYDNRWVALPQDFPSATLLAARGISQVMLIQEAVGQPKDDLAHILLRWQQAGLAIYAKDLSANAAESIVVRRPSRFKSLWYVLLVTLGMKRSSADGFGGRVPLAPAAGSGFHGGFYG